MSGTGLTSSEAADAYRRYGLFVRRRCLMLLRDAAAADDALLEVFLRVLRRGEGMKSADEPLRWLYRVTDNACFDHLRKRKRARESSGVDEEIDRLPCHPGTEPELRRAAARILALLSDEEQHIAVMAFVDGMTHQEIADELGYSRMTIVKRVASIRERAARETMRERKAAS